MAVAQTGIEALRWLRDESDSEASSRNLARHGHFGEAALVLGSRAAQKLPRLAYRDVVEKLLLPEFDLIGVGAEAIVLAGDDDKVDKYLTGKTQNSHDLAERLKLYDNAVRPYIGDFLLPTTIDRRRVKLFKGIPEQSYVHLSQPLVTNGVIDPHMDPTLLAEQPKLVQQLDRFSTGLEELFCEEGLLMDIVNPGNLVWTQMPVEKTPRLLLIDTLPVNYGETDFSGVRVPLWSPDLHLEALASFTLAHGPQQPLDLSLVITESLLTAYQLSSY